MERERTIKELAEAQVDENLDMVKMLNTLGARAAAFTVRDQQLAERDARALVAGVGEQIKTLGQCPAYR